MTSPTSAAVVVPVKAFTAAKVRLAAALDPIERAALARRMAEVVLAAAPPLPAIVVCDDDDVRAWAEAAGARVVWCPGRGLNGAVADGVAALCADGVSMAVVAHADLPMATRLGWVADFPGVTVVPDRRLDGTNVLAMPTDAGFRFSYGAGSFARHRAEARACGLPARIVRDDRLAWDVDLPVDLAWPSPVDPDTRARVPATGPGSPAPESVGTRIAGQRSPVPNREQTTSAWRSRDP
jgi:2-phospho-L-lactate/phosphoenolpyruvate guanylyltransferase